MVKQTNDLRKTGLSADTVAKRIDVTAHSAAFPQIRAVGIDPAGVRRIDALADRPEPLP